MSSVNHGGAASWLESSATIVTLLPPGPGRSSRQDAGGSVALVPGRCPGPARVRGGRRLDGGGSPSALAAGVPRHARSSRRALPPSVVSPFMSSPFRSPHRSGPGIAGIRPVVP